MKYRSGDRGRALVSALLMGTAIVGASIVPMQAALAQSSEQQQFSIPAGPLGAALSTFGQQSGLQLSYLASTTNGLSTGGFAGRATGSAALAAVLQGTGLSFSFIDNGTVAISGGAGNGAAVSTDGSIVLGEVNVSARLQSEGVAWDGSAETVYSTPAMVNHVSAESIAQFRGTSPADILRNVPGLISASSRTNGGIDPNIQGLQGMGRVGVTVDGAANSMTSYQGYQGVGNRSYIDPDFIGGVAVSKGPGIGANGVGAIAGSVAMRTISAADIIPEGETSAIRINAEVGTNTSPSLPVGTRTMTRSLLGYLWTAGQTGTPAAPTRDIDRPGILALTGGAGSVVYASESENVDLVLGVARRAYGNYHVGTTGGAAPELASDICATATGSLATYCNWGAIPYTIGLTTYLPGEQVLNTSQDVVSTLAKATFRLGDHSLELVNTQYDSVFGQTATLGFVTAGQLTDQNITSNVVLSTNSARYRYNPANDLIDLRLNAAITHMDEQNPEGVGGAQVVAKWADMVTVDASNTSLFDTAIGSATLNYGLAFQHEATGEGELSSPNSITPRNGNRQEASVFVAGSLEPTDWLRLDAGARYHYYWAKDLTDNDLTYTSERSGGAPDFNIGASVTPFEGVQLFANYSNAARMPSLFESISNSLMRVDDNLGPERASSWQLGANFTAEQLLTEDDSFNFKVGYFDNTIDDYIFRRAQRVELIPGYFYTALDITNLARAHFSGFEVAGQYNVGAFSALGSATYYTDIAFCRTLDTCMNSSLGADYSTNHVPPKFSASLTLSQKFLEDRLTISARGTYHGDRAIAAETPPAGANPLIAAIPWRPSFIFDAYAEYKLTERAKVTLSVENILDEYYVDPLAISLVPAPGRTIKLGFSGTFAPNGGFGSFDGSDVADTHNWSGFYVGGNVGSANASTRQDNYMRTTSYVGTDYSNTAGPFAYESGSGFGMTGGVRAGYDHQFDNNVVLGFDLGADWGQIAASQKQTDLASSLLMNTTYDLLASANVRVGIAHENLLVYGKAGLGIGHVSNNIDYIAVNGAGATDFNASTVATGLSAGAGIELALTDNISVYGEYQHMTLSGAVSGTAVSSFDINDVSFDNRSSVDQVKVGLNFRF